MELYDFLQGSDAWLRARCGKITGSSFAAVMALNKKTGAANAERRKLIARLRKELATGMPDRVEPNVYMAHGTRCEPIACALYEFERDVEVTHAALIPHPKIDYVAFSPDGLLYANGMVEFKCPVSEPRHTRTVISGKCPDDYYAQVQGGCWVCDREFCDFVSFWEPKHELCVVRVYRDETFIQRLAAECAEVWRLVNTQEELQAA